MDPHITDFLHTIVTLLAIYGAIWKIRKDISNEIDIKIAALEARLDKRFKAIDERLARVEQNH